uniref:Minor capsid protein P9 transmembrane helices domain-containing protein n=1 Tax=Marseillevirus LCMAC102 TaxID=2506603 RepID=A0A481YSJ2_9VIRU|nr:MAG: hypothetical protein LCMAC102_00380 [Marseillevirus LCMAC102]
MSNESEKKKFWIEDPCILLTNIFPITEMSRAEKLNALTRLAIVITIIMYFMKYEHWLIFLVLSVFIIIVLQYAGSKKDDNVEDFTIVPTYVGTDFQQTVVSPTFAEEWQIPPPAYDIYTQVPYPGAEQDKFEKPLKPQSYPYGQYLTRTNLLPSDEYYTHLGCGGARTAREYVNSTFLRHDLARRENMMRIYKKRLNRRFRHNCSDTFSPYHSY